jgi:serine protease Do
LLGQELAALVDGLRRVTVQVQTRGAGLGAGVVWNEELVVTNAHVARGERATIRLEDGSIAAARVVARDRRRDLAALELDRPPSTTAVAAMLRQPPSPRVGDLVIAVGHPGGHTGAATLGIIHAVDGNDADRPPRWIRADVRLAPGFSGGPLADAAGRVIGINTMMQGGLALAVPAAAVERWLR